MDRRAPAQPADRFSVCQHVLRLGDIHRDIAAAVEAGANGFSVNASDLGDVAIPDAARALSGAGLIVTSYIDPGVMRLGPGAPDLDQVRRAAEDAAAVGAPALLFIAGALDDRRVADADQQVTAALAAIAERIAGTGVVPMLEPLHPIARDLSFVHTVRHAAALVGPIDGAGIVVDTGASWWERDLVADIAANMDSVLAVQITDVVAAELTQRRYVREPCSAASAVPVADIVRDLVEAGYDGWFEHEVLAPYDPARRVEVLCRDREWFAALWTD